MIRAIGNKFLNGPWDCSIPSDENRIMRFVTTVSVVGLLLVLFADGNFLCLKKCDHLLGKIKYVDKKPMNNTAEGCATPQLIMGFYTQMREGFFKELNFE